jgi:hypothetical protein
MSLVCKYAVWFNMENFHCLNPYEEEIKNMSNGEHISKNG